MRLFVDNLTNIDFSYLHPQRGLLGETWFSSTELDGALDDQGMVCDFGIVKKTLRGWLDRHLDHCLLVPATSPNLKVKRTPATTSLSWSFSGQTLQCSSPTEAITLIDTDAISPESVAEWSRTQLLKLLPESLAELQLQFAAEEINGAFYHYSHGLKKHSGNCQRIAHGHRSQIQIQRNGQRDRGLEQHWAENFRDIYIGTTEDIAQEDGQNFRFAYATSQGAFELCLPSGSCYLIDSDSTIEWIATHMAEQLKKQYPRDQFTVRAFEGAGKGAIVSR